MAWFDGTFDESMEELYNRFPVRVNEDIFLSEDGLRMAIVNSFTEGSPLLALSDPNLDQPVFSYGVFYHVFTGENAESARKAVETLIEKHPVETEDDLTLYRYELKENKLFVFANGHICRGLLVEQEGLRTLLPDELKEETCYILPLKVYLHPCPVCGVRSLAWRGMYEICEECGWEDNWDDDPDEPNNGPNGDITIRQYRAEYLKLKEADPSYRWFMEEDLQPQASENIQEMN